MPKRIAPAVVLAALVVAGPAWGACPVAPAPERDVLLKLVPGRCLSGQVDRGDPAPCVLVVPGDGGYGVLKDRSPDKPFEYLVIPTAPVCGIEDPVLQEGRGPGYLKGAWQARGLLRVPHDTRPAQMVGVTIDTLEHVKAMLRERLGADIPDDAIGLAVNGRTARAQDQLHIHIGCLKASVRDALRRHPPGAAWGRVPEPLNGHAFFARSVSAAAWPGVNPFRELRALVGSDSAMNGAGLVVAGAPSGGFYVLASQAAVEAAGVDRGTGFGEGLLDHSCGVAGE